jgi:cytidylate kinase
MPFLIAIDGPAGAGKSVVARQVAMRLVFTYLDTGAMYRAVAWKALRTGTAAEEEAALAELARSMTLDFSPLTPEGTQTVTVDGRDVTAAIRLPEISGLTSQISALPAVRRVIVEQQRRIAQSAERGVVLEGRDIGTVVFPEAPLKIFLTASPEERARRRVAELQAKGLPVDYARTLAEQKERDARDSRRADSPLAQASDAIVLDTDGLSIEEVVATILEWKQNLR